MTKVAEQHLTSHQTHYRSYWGQDFMGQITQPTALKHWRKIDTKDQASIPSGPPHRAHNNKVQHICSTKQKHIKYTRINTNKSMHSEMD